MHYEFTRNQRQPTSFGASAKGIFLGMLAGPARLGLVLDRHFWRDAREVGYGLLVALFLLLAPVLAFVLAVPLGWWCAWKEKRDADAANDKGWLRAVSAAQQDDAVDNEAFEALLAREPAVLRAKASAARWRKAWRVGRWLMVPLLLNSTFNLVMIIDAGVLPWYRIAFDFIILAVSLWLWHLMLRIHGLP
jgi:hypothetical protein